MLLASISAWRDVAAGRLTPVLEDWRLADVGLHAVFPHRRHLAAKVRAFVDFLAERLGGDPARDPWWERIEAARATAESRRGAPKRRAA
jgi:DNA-binding transcriptional LysR family regulator